MNHNKPRSLVVDIGALREPFYTGIPNVIAEICTRLLREESLDLYFEMDGRWIDKETLQQCLVARSGSALAGRMDRFLPVSVLREALCETGAMRDTVALYTDYRPPQKIFPREGKIVHDLSMILTPECHPAEAAEMYVHDLAEQIICSDILFCVSEATARDLCWIYGVNPNQIHVALLGNNVELRAVERMRTLIGPHKVEPYLLVLGSIEPRKNTNFILRWLSEHPEIFLDMKVVFAGRQAWGDTFASMIYKNKLQNAVDEGRIVFTDYVDEQFRTALLVGAAGLIYASIYEGFGLPTLEAMTVGTPVICSVSSSIPEVVGECGYYFDPYSIDSLQKSYCSFLSDRKAGLISQLVAKGQLRAASFSYDKTYKIILDGLFSNH